MSGRHGIWQQAEQPVMKPRADNYNQRLLQRAVKKSFAQMKWCHYNYYYTKRMDDETWDGQQSIKHLIKKELFVLFWLEVTLISNVFKSITMASFYNGIIILPTCCPDPTVLTNLQSRSTLYIPIMQGIKT